MCNMQEYKCCGGMITQLCLAHDDTQLYVASADGAILIFDVKDKDPARLTSGKR